MTTLYRKYRPQKFEDITGQEHIVQTIINQISAGTPAHAYLFSGPRGVGKTTLARLLAKALNCEKRKTGSAEPCDECSSCQEISTGHNIDVIEIDAASHTGVDNVRENIIENAAFKPTRSTYKIFIIDEVHMLSGSAFNALLKTLEEPPAHVIFVLATTELQKLPATIISRCQRFGFKKIPLDLMLTRLKTIAKAEKKKIDSEVLERVALKSDGCLRDAESLLGQILSLDLDKITTENVQSVLPAAQLEEALFLINTVSDGKTDVALEQIDQLAHQGQQLEVTASDILEILRLSLITNAGCQLKEMALLTKGQRANVSEIAKKFTAEQIIQALDKTMDRSQEIKSAPLPQLPLEILMVELEQIFHSQTTKPKDGSSEQNNEPDSPATPNQTKRPDTPPTASQSYPRAENRPLATSVVDDCPPDNNQSANKQSIDSNPLTFDQAMDFWNKMIEQINGSNPSLTFILKMATVEKMENNKLIICLPFTFHRDKLEESKTKKLIETALTSVCGQPLGFICQIKATDENQNTEPAVQDIALTFGGEVIN